MKSKFTTHFGDNMQIIPNNDVADLTKSIFDEIIKDMFRFFDMDENEFKKHKIESVEFIHANDERIIQSIQEGDNGHCACGYLHHVKDDYCDYVFIVNNILVGINLNFPLLYNLKHICTTCHIPIGYAMFVFEGFYRIYKIYEEI